jgi:subtilisin family serine protease
MILAGAPDARLAAELTAYGATITRSFGLIPATAVGMTPEALRRFLAANPGARVLPDRRRQIPPMPFRADDWAEAGMTQSGRSLSTSPDHPQMAPLALSLMKAEEVHALGITGAGVRVCIIDSGVDFTHPDLVGTAILGPDGKPLAADFTETDLTDTIGHGTAVAGCIAAQGLQVYTINEETTGKVSAYTRIKGIAPGAKLMSAKVFDTRVGSGYDSAIIGALEWAVANGAQIINMSLGGTALPNDGSDALAEAVSACRARGVLVCVAAGNEGAGIGSLSSPGCSPGALTVGASTMYRSFSQIAFLAEGEKWTADQMASFSSQGPLAGGRVKPDLTAPGAYDWSIAPMAGSEEGKAFQLFGGTSQATPFTTGAAALLYQAYQKVHGRPPTPDEAIELLTATADPLGFPGTQQGTGRVNCLRAVRAAAGQEACPITVAPRPVRCPPGGAVAVELTVRNSGETEIALPLAAEAFTPDPLRSDAFHGSIAVGDAPQLIYFSVPSGIDLLQVSLGWPTEDHGERSARLMVAVYDPEGRFVNYQRPGVSGDVELGKSVDTWIARPQPGRWTMRVHIRLGNKGTELPYTLSCRAFQRQPWPWVTELPDVIRVASRGQAALRFEVRVPGGTPAATHTGLLRIGDLHLPLAVVVPLDLMVGRGRFAGQFQHGYQGSWGNGDWLYHEVTVGSGVRSLIATLQWPDVGNALECYLINPAGIPVLGRSNADELMKGEQARGLGAQFLLADPQPGIWRIALHSFAFCGRGLPEPYSGAVEAGPELVSPTQVQVRAKPGGAVPLALSVKNPGRSPLNVLALAQSDRLVLTWQTVRGEIKTGVNEKGEAQGEGYVTLSQINVPPGARQVGATLTWDDPDATVSLTMYDPVAANGHSETADTGAPHVSLLEPEPVPGSWTLIAGAISPGVERRTIGVTGAIFTVAPELIGPDDPELVTVPPGAEAVLPVRLALPTGQDRVTGLIRVVTPEGDQLGMIPFQLEAEEAQ